MQHLENLPDGIRAFSLKNGRTAYEARLNRSGVTAQQRFKTPAEAVAWRTQVEAFIDRGMDPTPLLKKSKSVKAQAPTLNASDTRDDIEKLTVKQALVAYIKHRQNSHYPIPSNYLTDYYRVRDDWGDYLVCELRNEDISNYITLLLKTPIKRDENKPAGEAKTYKAASVRKFVYALKIALQWHAENKGVMLDKFLFVFRKGKKNCAMPGGWENKRDRRLSRQEEDALYAAVLYRGTFTFSEADWRALIGFALESAMRQQEIAMACWTQISADNVRMTIPAKHTKTKTARTILLSARARQIIKDQRALNTNSSNRIFHQFPNAQAICEAFARLTKRAGIEDLHFHDLRHEATSRLCESGKLSQMTIMEMTGHSSMVTFKGYVHLIKDGTVARLD